MIQLSDAFYDLIEKTCDNCGNNFYGYCNANKCSIEQCLARLNATLYCRLYIKGDFV